MTAPKCAEPECCYFEQARHSDCGCRATEPTQPDIIAAADAMAEALEHILGGALSLPRFAEAEARPALAAYKEARK
jgi:hypothetical protein